MTEMWLTRTGEADVLRVIAATAGCGSGTLEQISLSPHTLGVVQEHWTFTRSRVKGGVLHGSYTVEERDREPQSLVTVAYSLLDQYNTSVKVYLTSLGPSKFGHNSFIFHSISKYQPALDSLRFSASNDVHYAG